VSNAVEPQKPPAGAVGYIVASESEMLPGEGAAGLVLEVSLEGERLGPVAEGDGGFNPPWEEL